MTHLRARAIRCADYRSYSDGEIPTEDSSDEAGGNCDSPSAPAPSSQNDADGMDDECPGSDGYESPEGGC